MLLSKSNNKNFLIDLHRFIIPDNLCRTKARYEKIKLASIAIMLLIAVFAPTVVKKIPIPEKHFITYSFTFLKI